MRLTPHDVTCGASHTSLHFRRVPRVPPSSSSSSPRGRSALAAVAVVCDEFSFENKGPPAVYRGASSHGLRLKKSGSASASAAQDGGRGLKRRALWDKSCTTISTVLPSLIRFSCLFIRPSVTLILSCVLLPIKLLNIYKDIYPVSLSISISLFFSHFLPPGRPRNSP